MRSVLLPVTDNYPVVGLWMKFYERWQHEVDKLEIRFGGPTHGDGIKELLLNTKADYIMLCEFDGIIFKPGFVDEMFKLLETDQFDVIGSPRMSCGPELANAAAKRWGLDYSGVGDKGPNFWPNFFFCKKHVLTEFTDLDFKAKGWKPGDYIKELQHTVYSDEMNGDTFVWASLQVRAGGWRIKEIPQYHSSPYDLDDYENNRNLWDGNCRYFHMGSMSGDLTAPNSELEHRELERRVMWSSVAGDSQAFTNWEQEMNLRSYFQTMDNYKKLLEI